MKTSMLSPLSSGSQQVSMNVRCPLTRKASNADNERSYDIVCKATCENPMTEHRIETEIDINAPRDFVPSRFSVAGRRRARLVSQSRRPKSGSNQISAT
jgi:hypothetical protein